MTPQLPVSQKIPRSFGTRQFVAVGLFVLGAWLVIGGTTSLLALHSNISARPHGNPSETWEGDSWWAWLLTVVLFVGLLRILLSSGLSLLIAGTGMMIAAVYCYLNWTPKTARHVVAAMVFLPGLWLIVTMVVFIPETAFLWRLLAIPLAFLIRYLAYGVADLVARKTGS